MHAVMWSDYVCPWAYLGRDRTDLMRSLGVTVEIRPYELHPEIPREGTPVRPGGRLDRVLDTIGAECADLGIPFRKPTRSPNTRRALETVEAVRAHRPAAVDDVDRALVEAHWVVGRDIGDTGVIDTILAEAGLDAGARAAVAELVADGVGTRAVDEWMALARSQGVAATPAWWVDERLLIPGAQPREAITRWITRLQGRTAEDRAPT